MNNIPITIIDDFLDNPDEIKEWGLSLKYSSPLSNVYPGKRTKPLKQIHPYYANFLNRKIVNLFFTEKKDVEINADNYFHIIEDYKGTGWIHQDWSDMTAILYLSEPSSLNRGTSLYKLKKEKVFLFDNQEEVNWYETRFKQFKGESLTKEEEKIKKDWEDKQFEKVIDIPDKYNRLIVFDPNYFHSANHLDPDPTSTARRYTLISFIHSVKTKDLYPIARSKNTVSL